MKNNNNLKICFAIAMLFSVCSIKAQSLHQKFQKDMEQRKKHANAVRVKANEQQLQQQTEITTTAIDSKPATDANQNQTGNTNSSVQKVQAELTTRPSSRSMRQPKKSAVPKNK